MELHLRVVVRPGHRGAFLEFLEGAIPLYERPGGIRIRLLEDGEDDHRFIEVVEYADEATYRRDQERVGSDAQMRRTLERWRELLAEPPVVERYIARAL